MEWPNVVTRLSLWGRGELWVISTVGTSRNIVLELCSLPGNLGPAASVKVYYREWMCGKVTVFSYQTFLSRSTYSHGSFSSRYPKRFYFLSFSCKKCQDGSPFSCATGLLSKTVFVQLRIVKNKIQSRTLFFRIFNIYYLTAASWGSLGVIQNK